MGDTLVSTVGAWKTASTTFVRRWMRCEADGGSCEYINSNAVRDLQAHRRRPRQAPEGRDQGRHQRREPAAGDLRLHAAERRRHHAAPAAGRPAADPDADAAGRRADPDADPERDPAADAESDPGHRRARPRRQAPSRRKLKPNTALKLKATLSEGASLSVSYERKVIGRKVGKTCKAGAKKGKKCTTYKKLATVKVSGMGGSSTVTLPKRKLAAGDYRVVVTPVDAAGNKGAAKTVSFKVLKK